MNYQRSRLETISIIIGVPERGSSVLGTVCYYCCPQSNKLSLACRGPYKVVGTVGEVLAHPRIYKTQAK